MNKKNKNEANITLDNQPNQRLEINQPEWLQGAFIASAW
jgi:putative endonuclease